MSTKQIEEKKLTEIFSRLHEVLSKEASKEALVEWEKKLYGSKD